MKRDRRGRFLTPRRLERHPEGRQRAGAGRCRRAARARDSGTGADGETGAETLLDDKERKAQVPEEEEARPRDSGLGKTLNTGYCRLCHGKFSSRSLRNAFGKVPVVGESLEKQRRVDQVFFTDFQQLVGVPVQQDSSLPQFVCKNCHAQFYKCRSVLKAFIQKVNASPMGLAKTKGRASSTQTLTGAERGTYLVDLITSSPQCLHSLVTWTHNHAGNCQSVPDLQSVLSSQYCGIIRAVWGCGDGHDYVMATDSDCSTFLIENALSVKWAWNNSTAQVLTDRDESVDSIGADPSSGIEPQPVPSAVNTCENAGNNVAPSESVSSETCPAQCRNSSFAELEDEASVQECESQQSVSLSDDVQEQVSRMQTPSPAASYPVKDEFCGLSDRDFVIEEEQQDKSVAEFSDDFFQPFLDRKEELPTIYKCPYQGCTAVYRGADGMKKHIKEHHEEVRERPCPHPGCNKVFMIDRYLQRHVKLIHTEERNYICDQCGQTFKQRKHLSVHQMRHSGAKPLQCEICGFQCRQRASLKYHMTKHKAEAELEFACDQCGKRFEKAHNLNVHMSMVHPLVQNMDKPLAPEQTVLQKEPDCASVEGQALKAEQLSQQEPG
ncbi:zinc finger protein 276 isoform X2 [Microcaecilia unicolor]|uniref:Zinc finger protein 276 n=1 Tax=Microcaecilia unicolor TaxID=1415580 RepID=A0A6P7Y673_9AMPH|nr:zinc finger protein 276-like isoform X2 [Microcaecilia unicolor]